MVRCFSAKLFFLSNLIISVAIAQGVPEGFTPTVNSQPARPHRYKDIPSIAQAAKPAIVLIVMLNKEKPIALGTGFVVRSDGVILTNYHVIETGNSAVVKFADGTVLPVDGLLAADKIRDLAAIKIHGKLFRILALGNSDKMQVGEEVVAIGNPQGLELTVSNGILSGLRTDQEAGGKFLQITAPITHGSSGGPLFNLAGEVIGITTLGLEGGGDLNFAIPVNDAKSLLLKQSVELRHLPDEAPQTDMEHAEGGQATQNRPATLEEQRMCADQADQAFRKRNESAKWMESYISHYNAEKGICFVEMSSMRVNTNPQALIWNFTKDVGDAYGGKSYAFFQKNFLKAEDGQFKQVGQPCFIYLSGPDDIVCKSEQEFDALTQKYFGIAP